MAYHLIHIIANGEFALPLVTSQVFDRAQAQTINGPDKPKSVSVWIVEPIDFYFDPQTRNTIRLLRKRCPNVSIKLMGGFSRLKTWPTLSWLIYARKKMGKEPAVYHCRGESCFQWGEKLTTIFSKDATVLDIRGYWPLERHAPRNIFDVDRLNELQRKQYNQDVENLQKAIATCTMLTTVSVPLRDYLVNGHGADRDSYVIPCGVPGTVDDTYRNAIRQEMGVSGKKAILYLGGTQKYQHLDDLVLPFFKSALQHDEICVAVFISQDIEVLKVQMKKFDIPMERTRLLSVSQQEVGKYLTAMDAGLLLRAPSFLNNFSQPVKLGEYLAAGLPVIVENGTGNVQELLADSGTCLTVKLTGKIAYDFDNEVKRAVDWIEPGNTARRSAAREFVAKYYTWAANVPVERNMYMQALSKVPQKVKNES